MKTQTFLMLALFTILTASFSKGFSAEKQINAEDYEPINIPADLLKVETEVQLQLASWMTNDAQWMFETEDQLEIAPWMINDALWNEKAKQTMVQEKYEAEENLAIESWMTDDNLWIL